ncbi:MAG: thioredoxin family protein [Anaerolineales bacterium]|nr:thioredoxin family protein [Anaerolineales bacterium]
MPKPKHTKRRRHAPKQPPNLLILAGIALLLIAVFAFKSNNDSAPSSASGSLESQLDQALAAKRPTFVFLHSLNCVPCKAMMETVADVYPDFQDSVVLIDVNIYDESNSNILQRKRLQSIPTLVFYNAQGTRQVFIGAMPAEQFRDALTLLATGQ